MVARMNNLLELVSLSHRAENELVKLYLFLNSNSECEKDAHQIKPILDFLISFVDQKQAELINAQEQDPSIEIQEVKPLIKNEWFLIPSKSKGGFNGRNQNL